MTWRCAIHRAPCDRLIVTIAGRSWGVRPTARASENRAESMSGRLSTMLTTKMVTTSTTMARTSRKPNAVMPRSKLVSTGAVASRSATRPNSVLAPVRTTTAVPEPLTTWVPMNSAFRRWPIGAPAPVVPGDFVDRIGLAGQGRLVHEQGPRLDDAAVAGDDVTGVELDHVTGDDRLQRDLGHGPVAEHFGVDAHHGHQVLDGSARAPLLPEPEEAAEHDDGQDDHRIGEIAEQPGQDRGGDQDEDDRARELTGQQGEGTSRSLGV